VCILGQAFPGEEACAVRCASVIGLYDEPAGHVGGGRCDAASSDVEGGRRAERDGLSVGDDVAVGKPWDGLVPGLERCARGHSGRPEDVRIHVVPEGLAAEHFDQPRGNLVVRVVVVPLRTGIRHQPCRAEAGDGLDGRRGLRAVQVVHFAIRETGGLVEELPHGDVGAARVGQSEIRQVHGDRIFQRQ
jgi:hypothetical protein